MDRTALLPLPALVAGAAGTVHEANALADAMAGRGAGGLVARGLAGFVTRPEVLDLQAAAADADGVWRAQVEAVRGDGVPFPLDVVGRVIEVGPPAVSLVVLHDRNVDGGLLTLAQQHFDAAFDHSPIGMALYNTDGQFVRVNQAMCTVLGRSPEQLLGKRDQVLTHPADRDADLEAAGRILAGESDTHQVEKRFVRPDGEVVWVMANLSFLRDEHDRPIAWLGQFQDVTSHRELAERDPLTQAFNRRRLLEALTEALHHGTRYAPRCALILFDLDGFKTVNDRHGHRAGDEVLIQVVRRVDARVRESDVVARLGGDEFAVLLPHVEDDGAERVAADLVRLVAGLEFDFAPEPGVVTASVGVAQATEQDDAETLLAAADAALYCAKRADGDGFRSRDGGPASPAA